MPLALSDVTYVLIGLEPTWLTLTFCTSSQWITHWAKFHENNSILKNLNKVSVAIFASSSKSLCGKFAKQIKLFTGNNLKDYCFSKMLGLYFYTLIIGHKSCNMLSILNKLKLQKILQNVVTNNVCMDKK